LLVGVGAAGLALVAGLSSAAVAGPTPIATLTMSPTPIAPTASLLAKAAVTVTVTALDSTGRPIDNAVVYIAFQPTTGGGTAMTHKTALNFIPEAFRTGLAGTIKVTYHAPANPQPTSGSDWIGVTANPFNSNVIAQDTYTFAPSPKVTAYKVSPRPIAPTGVLTVGSVTPVTVTALSSSNTPVPFGAVYLSFTAGSGGAGTAFAHGVQLTSTPQLFHAGSTGQLSLSYHVLGPAAGTDTVTIANAPAGATVTVTDSYTF
jgi:hypothetical protein